MGQEQSALNEQTLRSTSPSAREDLNSADIREQRARDNRSPSIRLPLKRPASFLDDERSSIDRASSYERNRQSSSSNRQASQVIYPSNMRHSFVRDEEGASSPRSERSLASSGTHAPRVTPNGPARRHQDSPARSDVTSSDRGFDWANVPAGPKALSVSSSHVEVADHPMGILAAKSQPHVFIAAKSLPAELKTKKHLWAFLRRHKAEDYGIPRDIFVDSSGWYLMFENTDEGRARVVRCVEEMDGQMMFSMFKLTMQPFPNGYDEDRRPSLPTRSPITSVPNRSGPAMDERDAAYTEPQSPHHHLAPSAAQGISGRPGLAPHTQNASVARSPTRMNLPRYSLPSTSDEPARKALDTEAERAKGQMCVVCRKETGAGMRLVRCSICLKSYHRHCHTNPPINPSMPVQPSWRCTRCVSEIREPSPERPAKRPRLDSDGPMAETTGSVNEARNSTLPDANAQAGTGNLTSESQSDKRPVSPIRSDRTPNLDDADALVDMSFATNHSKSMQAHPAPKGKLKITRSKIQKSKIDSDLDRHPQDQESGSGFGPAQSPKAMAGTHSHFVDAETPRKHPSKSTAADLRADAMKRQATAMQTQAKIQDELIAQGQIPAQSRGTMQGYDKSAPDLSDTDPRLDSSGKVDETHNSGSPVSMPASAPQAASERLSTEYGSDHTSEDRRRPGEGVENPESPVSNLIRVSSLAQSPATQPEKQLSSSNDSAGQQEKGPASFKLKSRKGSSSRLIPCARCQKNKIMRDPQGINKLCMRCKEAVTLEQQADHETTANEGTDDDGRSEAATKSSLPPKNPHKPLDKEPLRSGHSASLNPDDLRDSGVVPERATSGTLADPVPKASSSMIKDAPAKRSGPTKRSCEKCIAYHRKCTHHTAKSPEHKEVQTAGSNIAPSSPADEASSMGALNERVAAPNPDTTPAQAPTTGTDQLSPERMEKLTAALGDVHRRPAGALQKLLGMAFMSAPGHRARLRDVTKWISEHIPGFEAGKGNWEASVAAHLSSRKSTPAKPGCWTASKAQGDEDATGKGFWYTLMPGVAETLWQWDDVLKEPSSPQSSTSTPLAVDSQGLFKKRLLVKLKAPMPAKKQSEVPLPVVTPSRDDVQKPQSTDRPSRAAPSNAASTAAKRSAETSPIIGENDMDIDSPVAVSIDGVSPGLTAKVSRQQSSKQNAVDHGHETSEDEPLVRPNKGIARSITKAPTAIMQPTPSFTDGNGPSDAEKTGTRKSSLLSMEHLMTRQVEPMVQKPKEKPRLNVAVAESGSDLSLLELIRLDNKLRPWTTRPFFEEHPEYRHENLLNKQEKMLEIRTRPTRKQMFGKPASHSRLAKPKQEEPYCPPAARGNVSPEKRPRRIVDALPTDSYAWESPDSGASQEFASLQDFFGLPHNPIPITSEGQLAFRDGTRTEEGRLPRAKVVYKVG